MYHGADHAFRRYFELKRRTEATPAFDPIGIRGPAPQCEKCGGASRSGNLCKKCGEIWPEEWELKQPGGKARHELGASLTEYLTLAKVVEPLSDTEGSVLYLYLCCGYSYRAIVREFGYTLGIGNKDQVARYVRSGRRKLEGELETRGLLEEDD